MPSKTDFNVSPYYDDFAESKKFHRIMNRPAFAIQARELTAAQSLMQNQIEKMGDHLFKHGAMVIPGQINADLEYEAVKLTSFNGTLSLYNGETLTGSTSGVIADVVGFVATDGTDPDTLFVKYKNSGTNNTTETFTDGETITSGQTAASTAVVSETVIGSAVHIDAGVYYINGFFVNVDAQTLVLEKYFSDPSYRVGLTITETFVTSTDDTSLLDNATGASNENAPGAHRFKIDLTLTKLALESTADASFVELLRINSGRIQEMVTTTKNAHLEDTLARRTFDESGDYTVRNFDLDVRESLINGTNRGIFSADGTTDNTGVTPTDALLALGFSSGVAYVKGYEVRKVGTTYIDVNKARDFDTASGIVTRFNVGAFVNVENVFGTPDIGFVDGDVASYKPLRLVDTVHGTRGTVFGTALAHVFDIGRAKSRAFEFNSGTAVSPDSGASTHLSSSTVSDVIFKHFLFDIEMFSHLNVKGSASGALTTGETLTGGTSGATGVVESITSATSVNITGVTLSQPVVVTMSGGHNYTEGQQVLIAGITGTTQLNGEYFTVKNATSTTIELFEAQTTSDGGVGSVDGTSYTAWSSGGTVVHTTIVLNDIQGEFTENETATGGSSGVTAVIQFNTLGCKGFEQKTFNQTKGISMAGSPTYTANVSLDSVNGDNTVLTGTISSSLSSEGSLVLDGTNGSSANAGDQLVTESGTQSGQSEAIGLEQQSADTIIGSGTKFKSQLKIGDQITFIDDSNKVSTRIIDSIISDTQAETTVGLGGVDATTVSFTRQRGKLQDAGKNIAISKIPYDVVKTLLTTDNASVSDTSFKIRKQFTKTLSSSGTATLTAGTNEIFSAFESKDYSVSIMTTGSGGTGAAGDVIDLSTGSDFTLAGSPTGKTLNINLGTGYNGHKIKVLATLSTSTVGAKTKTSTAITKTVDTLALVSESAISLGKPDVHKLNAVYMAADFSTAATTSDTDVTSRFDLDNGQRDNFYDLARLKLRPGKQIPTGRLLIDFEYFEHGAGNFFSVDSYSGFDYANIPSYVSDVSGESFQLRDVLDFRPRVDNASTIDSGDIDRSFDGTGGSVIETMKIGTDVTSDLEFYLSKKARVYVTSQGEFKVVEGPSSLDPTFGESLKQAMHLYDLDIPAYTFSTEDIFVKPIENKRYTMRDIGNIERRVENIEYYTQLSLLESAATGMQIQDADGFDRFKNGIIVDNFTGHGIGNVSDNDYSIAMDMAAGELRPSCHSDNVNLIESDNLLANSSVMNSTDGFAINSSTAAAIRKTNGYQLTGDLITLPYTSTAFITQPLASTTVNLQPYEMISYVGNINLSPDMDEWKDTETLPEMTVSIPGTFDILSSVAAAFPQELGMGTIWNEWNNNWAGVDIAGTNRTNSSSSNSSNTTRTNRNITTTSTNNRREIDTVNVQQVNNRTRTGIRSSLVPGGLQTQSLGNRVVQVAFAPFMRARDIEFTAQGLKPSTRFYPFFNDEDVSIYCRPTTISQGSLTTGGITTNFGFGSGSFPTIAQITAGTITLPTSTVGNYGGSLISDSSGKVTGVFSIPDPKTGLNFAQDLRIVPANLMTTTPSFSRINRPGPFINTVKFRTGTKSFRLTSSSTNSKQENLVSSAEADYTAKGLLETVQGTVTSSREAKIVRTGLAQSSVVKGSIGTRITRDQTFATTTVNTTAITQPTPRVNPPRRDRGGNRDGGDRGSRGRDPVCQSFAVDVPDGIFLTSVELFFKTKNSAAGVNCQIRTMENGTPTTTVLPFGEAFVEATDISVSDDATTGTTFTFPSPIFLAPYTDYAFMAESTSKDYEMFTARMGQTTLDSSRLISKQPTLGGMFKSQNASTWTAEQNEDVKFTLKRALFDVTAAGNVHLVNDTIKAKVLPQNPITTISGILNEALDTSETTITLDNTSNFPSAGTILIGSEQITYTGKSGNDLTGCTRGANSTTAATANDGVAVGCTTLVVNHRNHGMHSTSHNVTISGVPSGTFNGVASSNINGTYTAIDNIKLDSYTIIAQSSDFPTASGDIGGTLVQATRNILYDVIQPIVGNVLLPGCYINATLRKTGGRTIEQSETEFTLQAATKARGLEINQDLYLESPGMVCSQINETNEMSGSKSIALNLTMNSPFDNISPVIDTKRLSATVIANRINNPISGTTPDFKEETTNQGGSVAAKYITRPVLLENESTSLDVRLSAQVPSTAAVKMYYRVSNADDARNMDDLVWIAFNADGTPDKAVDPSDDGITFRELQFSFQGAPTFTAFALKIVLTGTSSCYPPKVKDMRGIALAV